MERDEKGRYLKGNGPINKDVAREYQARSAVVRKENRKERETLAEVLKV